MTVSLRTDFCNILHENVLTGVSWLRCFKVFFCIFLSHNDISLSENSPFLLLFLLIEMFISNMLETRGNSSETNHKNKLKAKQIDKEK